MTNDRSTATGGTRIEARVVDVVVLAPHQGPERWRVLAMRRAAGTRCTGAWEIVHGRIEPGERPPIAAQREVREETGLAVERLYSITVNPFYLHTFDSVQLAVVFAAIVPEHAEVTLGPEHDAWEWLAPAEALERLAWPREHQAVQYALHLLRTGDAGPVEDVLRVPVG
jgi:8-oxo-dGTP pyrophosphatase MutT (NUDIX family)